MIVVAKVEIERGGGVSSAGRRMDMYVGVWVCERVGCTAGGYVVSVGLWIARPAYECVSAGKRTDGLVSLSVVSVGGRVGPRL